MVAPRYIYIDNEEKIINLLNDLQTKLKESETKFKTIFDKSADGIAIADIKTKKFTEVNKAFCRYTGYSKKELLKTKILSIHPKNQLPYVLNEFKQQSQKKKTLAEKIPILRRGIREFGIY